MFLSILLLFIFIKRSFFSNFLHILCPFIVYFASFVDSIGNIHASRNLFYHLWKLTTLCKMNEFPRRHFYVPFWEFVHLHMQYYFFANTILKCAAFQFFTPAGKPTVNFYFTFTVTIAFFFPALTVIFAVPAFLAFTTPFAFTVATFLLLLVNVTLSEAVIG